MDAQERNNIIQYLKALLNPIQVVDNLYNDSIGKSILKFLDYTATDNNIAEDIKLLAAIHLKNFILSSPMYIAYAAKNSIHFF